jgi:MiaB/RimO family radical SAM methylthiotransferase
VASCVVTDKAKRKWVKFVKDIFKNKELKKWQKVFISWCWAFEKWKKHSKFFEIYPDLKEFEDKIEILWEDPNLEKAEKNILKEAKWIRKIEKNDKLENLKNKLQKEIYTKKFVVIQWGCDSFCSFCLTVQKRWKHFYRAKEDIVEEILDFEKNNWKEVVLTWVNLSAWGLENTNEIWKSRFAELLEYILEKTNIKRIRISSLWPEFIDDKTIKLFENTRIYPHFHFSIQSWSTKVLKNMKRHYSWEYMAELLWKVRKIKRKDWVLVWIWADLIVGFPWETEKDFLETCDLIEKYEITKVHSFPFSAHNYWENVPAWFFPDQIPENIKKERMKKIEKIAEKVRNNFIEKNIWKKLEVLIEVEKNGEFKWWTQNYIEVTNKNFEVISGKIAKNEIVVWKVKK